jgi:glycosyltransferase involved in cell wall biosynthesis
MVRGGAYLEPDLHFGSAYLNATGRAATGLTHDTARPKLLLVGHDAFPSGAQHLLLNIGKTLRSAFGVEIEFLLLAGGQLEDDYAAVAPLTVLRDAHALAGKIQELAERGFTAALVNTTAAGEAAALLAARGLNTILLVHELPRLLREKRLEDKARAGIAGAQHVVFPASFVRDKVVGALEIPASRKMLVRPQGSYKRIVAAPEARTTLRKKLRIPSDARLILGVGYADLRKGFDLFLQLWRLTRRSRAGVHCAWVGGIDPVLAEWLAVEIEEANASGTFHMFGYRDDVNAFFSAADAFALTSREDPFPTVALEAMSAGVPVFAFDESGGIPELLKENALGYVVPYCDVPAMADKLDSILAIDEDMRRRGKQACEQQFAFAPYARDLLRLAAPQLPRLSVVVPNFNYAHCLRDRLNTIFDQTHPVEEIIILDDASTDDSIAAIEDCAEQRARDVTLVINDANSGSVFAQWARGAAIATGEFVWIAEADDLSEPPFLSRLLALMRTDPSIRFGFCDSRSIDAEGAPVYPSYKPYFATLEPNALERTEIFAGTEFITRFLSAKNTILNVSSVVWRRDALRAAIAASRKDLARYRMAGDWRIYLECLSTPNAKIAYVSDPLNVHRRHAQSVTHALKAQTHVDEIRAIHGMIRDRFKLPKAALARQADYIEEVTEQLLGKGARHRKPSPGKRPAGKPEQSPPQLKKPEMKPAPSSVKRRHPGAPSPSTDSVDS